MVRTFIEASASRIGTNNSLLKDIVVWLTKQKMKRMVTAINEVLGQFLFFVVKVQNIVVVKRYFQIKYVIIVTFLRLI